MKFQLTGARVLSFVVCFTLLWVCSSHGNQQWRCRVGVAGGWASGFGGALARNGIPHELLLNHQLSDLAVLQKFDLVMLGSLHPSYWPQAVEPLERYVQGGGAVFLDSHYNLVPLANVSPVNGQTPLLAQYFGSAPCVKRSVCSFKIIGADNPLLPEATAEPYGGLNLANRVLASFPGAKILAELALVNIPDSEKANNLPAASVGEPAMVLIPRGNGFYLLCAPSLSVGLTLSGTDVESVVVAIVRLLTRGKGLPQLAPERYRLVGGHSAITLKLASRTGKNESMRCAYVSPVRAQGPGKPAQLPPGCQMLTEERDAEFTITGRYDPTAGDARMLLNYWNDRAHWSLTFKGPVISLAQIQEGRRQWEKSASLKDVSSPVTLVVKERSDRILVYARGMERIQSPTATLWDGAIGVQGHGLRDLRYQPVGAVYFADDFMRTQDQQGEWEVLSGDWRTAPVQNPELGANPFSYRVSSAGGDAFAVAGRSFWDNYLYRVAARPEGNSGLLGIIAYVEDKRNFWLFLAKINSSATAFADGFQLIRVADGNPLVLQKTAGALVQGQWYELALKIVDRWVGAYVDGEKVLSLSDTSLSGGKVGLWLRNAEVKFDDVEVKSVRTQESQTTRVFRGVTPSYAGVIDQDSWAGPANEWRADPETQGFFRNKTLFFGDGGVEMLGRVLLSNGKDTRADTTLWVGFGAPPDRTPEDRIGVWARHDQGQLHLSISRNETILRRARVPVDAKTPPLLSFTRKDNQFTAAVNGQSVLSVADNCLNGAGYHAAFQVRGARARISDVSCWSDRVYNDTFENAPVDWWVQQGVWDVTNRWSCSPGWSWFGGHSPLNAQNQYAGVAAVWSKRAFTGDVSVRFFTGPKMLVTPNTNTILEQMRDFNLTLYGDSKDVRSGYTFLVAPAGASKAQLLRQGSVVAETTHFIMPPEGHNRWIELTGERIGNTIRLLFDGQLTLQYEDPQPLSEGHVAIWTEGNGVIVPRVTISFAQQSGALLSRRLATPLPRADAAADIGRVFDFSENVAGWWSTDIAAAVAHDTSCYHSPPAALCYKFQPRAGALPVLLSPQLRVAGAKSVSLYVRASCADRPVLTLMEEDMSRYVTTVAVSANDWLRLELPFTRFLLAQDSADENGKLDPEEICALTFTDMDAVTASTSEQSFPERQMWIDNVTFSK